MRSTIVNSLANRADRPVSEIISAFKPNDLATEFQDIVSKEELVAELSDLVLPTVTFQVSFGWKSTLEDPKFNDRSKYTTPPYEPPYNTTHVVYDPFRYTCLNAKGWGEKYPSPNYSGIDWHTVTTLVSVLPKVIAAGFVVRFGVKTGSNAKSDFEFAQFIGFDLDQDPSISWQRTLEIAQDFLLDPLLIYYSPSGNEKNNKLRMVLALSTSIEDLLEYRLLAARVAKVFPNCAFFGDACRFWYGSIRDLCYVSNDYTQHTLSDLDHLPSLTDQETSNLFNSFSSQLVRSSEEEQGAVSLLVKFSRYLTSHVLPHFDSDLGALINYWIDHFSGKGVKLYKGDWYHEFNDGTSEVAWNGTHPIRGGTTAQSDSFVISRCVDDSYVYSIDHSNVGGNIVELYAALSRGDFDHELSNAQWNQYCDEICKLHQIPLFSQSAEKKKKPHQFSQDFLYEDKNGNLKLDYETMMSQFLREHEGLFYRNEVTKGYYIYKKSCWVNVSKLDSVRTLVVSWLEAQGVPDEVIKTSRFTPTVTNILSSLSDKHVVNQSFPFEENWIVFEDGAFNMATKEFKPGHSSDIRNFYVLPYSYSSTYNDLCLEPFRAYWRWLIDRTLVAESEIENAIEDLIWWTVAVLQNKGFDTRRFLYVLGSPGSGKSDYINTFFRQLVYPQVSADCLPNVVVNVQSMLDESRQFGRNNMKNKSLAIINEFSELPRSCNFNVLKTLIGSSAGGFGEIGIEAKNGAQETLRTRMSFIFSSEKPPALYTSADNDGIYRRILAVPVVYSPVHNEQSNKVFSGIKDPAWARAFFNWAIHQDIQSFIQRCDDHTYMQKSWMKKTIENFRFENDNVAVFFQENYEWSQEWYSQGKGVIAGELFNSYVQECSNKREKNIQSQSKFGAKLLKYLFATYQWSEEFQLKKRTNKGYVYLGVKEKEH